MTQPNPRQQMRDLIAETEGKRRNGAASDGRGWYRSEADRDDCYAVADAVMELFPDVEVERTTRTPGLVIPFVNYTLAGYAQVATHTQFVLRTAPEQIAEEPA